MIWTIYRITNLVNGKLYFGQTTKTLVKRWKKHCEKTNKCKYLRNAIQKYGKENFIIEPIVYIETQVDADNLEKFFIKQYMSCNGTYGYNIALGGNSNMLGRKHSDESKKKISEAKMGNQTHLGHKATDEQRKRMSDAQKGRPGSRLGHKATEETIKKLSESHKGKIPSETTRKKMSDAQTARYKKLPEEIKNEIVNFIRENNRGARLEQEEIDYIRMLAFDGYAQKDIGNAFDRSPATISRIVNYKIKK